MTSSVRALDKLERRTAHGDPNAALRLDEAILRVAEILKPKAWLSRIACETGRGVTLVEVRRISHFVSEDRHSYACAETGRFLVNRSLSELETRLDPACFLRIHRSAIVNLHFVDQLSGWFEGRIPVKLRDAARTELTVSRTSVDKLRGAVGMCDARAP